MNSLIPTADTIPAASGCFRFLLLLVFPLHLVLMNAMFGSTAIAAYAFLKKDEAAKRLAQELAKTIPFLIAFAVNLGVASLLFLQVIYGQFFYTSSVLIGAYWIAVIPLLIMAYYAVYVFDLRFSSLKKPGVALICLSLAVFLSIAFIFTNNMTLMLNPDSWRVYVGHSIGAALNLGEQTLLPRYLHFIVGGTAIGGLFVAMFGRVRRKMEPKVRAVAERTGMRVFTFMTGVQLVVGVLFLASLPRHLLLLFMGGDILATTVFAAGVILTVLVLVAGMSRKVWMCVGLIVPLIYSMSFMRDFVRTGYLELYFSPSSLHVVPQYSPMIMFFIALFAGLATVAWMLKKVATSFVEGSGGTS